MKSLSKISASSFLFYCSPGIVEMLFSPLRGDFLDLKKFSKK
jgi:hypothetical protein